MIAVVDSGGANLASVMFALERLGRPATFTADPDIIARASHVILPGVGAAAAAMDTLNRHGLVDALRTLKQPVLGICLGMQLLFDWSAEGEVDLLKFLPGRVEKFNAPKPLPEREGLGRVLRSSRNDQHRTTPPNPPLLGEGFEGNLPVPHMGWNILERTRDTPLLKNLPSPYVYFVHSYRAPLGDFTVARTTYGETFSSVVAHDNIFGCQFHPERSGAAGSAILKNFIEL